METIGQKGGASNKIEIHAEDVNGAKPKMLVELKARRDYARV